MSSAILLFIRPAFHFLFNRFHYSALRQQYLSTIPQPLNISTTMADVYLLYLPLYTCLFFRFRYPFPLASYRRPLLQSHRSVSERELDHTELLALYFFLTLFPPSLSLTFLPHLITSIIFPRVAVVCYYRILSPLLTFESLLSTSLSLAGTFLC